MKKKKSKKNVPHNHSLSSIIGQLECLDLPTDTKIQIILPEAKHKEKKAQKKIKLRGIKK